MQSTLKRLTRYLWLTLAVILLVPALLIAILRFVNPPVSAYMIRAHIQSGAGPAHDWVGLDAIAPCMPLAAVAAEDQTFGEHHGFAWAAIGDALAENANGGPIRGASTISQQTAKNLFLWPAKSYTRKAIEAYLTVWLELLWSKRRIMAVYLNIAQFADGVFGVGAAAQQLFHTSAAKLTRAQCAALAAVLPAPKEYDAATPGPYVAKQKAWILRQMRHLGPDYLTETL